MQRSRDFALALADQRNSLLALFLFIAFSIITIGQNGLALMASWMDEGVMLLVLTAKDALVFLVVSTFLLVSIGITRRISRYTWVFLAMIGVVFLYYPVSPAANPRQLRVILNLPLMFLFGLALANYTSVYRVRTFLLKLLFIVALTGFIERFVLWDPVESFWNTVGFSNYFVLREGNSLNLVKYGVPGSFDTYDYYAIVGGPVRRMVSLFTLDPILLGHALVLPLAYCVSKRRVWLALFFGVAVFLTFSKGAWLAAALAIVLVESSMRPSRLRSLALYGGFVLAAAYFSLTLLAESSSVARHGEGLLGGFQSLLTKPLGGGIGSGGNLALRELRITYGSANISFAEQGGESYLASTMVQIGVFGLLGYLYFMRFVWKIRPVDHWVGAIRAAAFATLLAGIGGETPVSWVGTGILFALVPLAKMASWKVEQHERANAVAASPKRASPRRRTLAVRSSA